MRIDYSEPKKSYKTPQSGHNRPRNESSGTLVTVVVITCLISLGVGFGSGWMLSQRYAKKGFKAAMEQQSLENSPRQSASPPKAQTITPPPTDTLQQPATGGAKTPPIADGTQTTPDPPLSFYKNLPSGQKNNALGSGINTRDEKPAKHPLQAAIPANITKPSQPDNAAETPKPATPATTEKNTGRKDANAFTVQVASHSLKSEAEALKNKLASKGYSVHIAESNQGSKGIWYRVRVGRGLEQEAAKELAGRLGKGAMAIPDKD
jgi:cell division protein FtsN